MNYKDILTPTLSENERGGTCHEGQGAAGVTGDFHLGRDDYSLLVTLNHQAAKTHAIWFYGLVVIFDMDG